MSDIFFRWDSLFDRDNGYNSIIRIPPLNFDDGIFGNAIIIELHQNSIQYSETVSIRHHASD